MVLEVNRLISIWEEGGRSDGEGSDKGLWSANHIYFCA